MVDLLTTADPGPGHLRGHLSGSGQAVAMAAFYVSTPAAFLHSKPYLSQTFAEPRSTMHNMMKRYTQVSTV